MSENLGLPPRVALATQIFHSTHISSETPSRETEPWCPVALCAHASMYAHPPRLPKAEALGVASWVVVTAMMQLLRFTSCLCLYSQWCKVCGWSCSRPCGGCETFAEHAMLPKLLGTTAFWIGLDLRPPSGYPSQQPVALGRCVCVGPLFGGSCHNPTMA